MPGATLDPPAGLWERTRVLPLSHQKTHHHHRRTVVTVPTCSPAWAIACWAWNWDIPQPGGMSPVGGLFNTDSELPRCHPGSEHDWFHLSQLKET